MTKQSFDHDLSTVMKQNPNIRECDKSVTGSVLRDGSSLGLRNHCERNVLIERDSAKHLHKTAEARSAALNE
jgi:hypothetical protein